MTSDGLKSMFAQKGADICGIAPVSRFKDAPAGFHPNDICRDCKSVLVFACRFPKSTLGARTNSPYTFVRNMMVQKCDMLSFTLSDELERQGIMAIPIPSSEPYDFWDTKQRQGRGILSLKHAAVLAGLGVIGKNTLLVNDELGNMTWLGAVLLPLELEPDPLVKYEGCIKDCTICIDSCPQNALDGTTLNQSRCRERVFRYSDGGGWVITCNMCRTICPNCSGI
jgi:epoxyqueuosine reductase